MEMTKNEYQEYVKQCAHRFHTESGYSIRDFEHDTEAVTVLPFDLSKFPQIKEHTQKMINILFEEEDKDKDGNYMLRGASHFGHEYTEMQTLGCKYGDYSNGYSFFAYNADEYLIYTYCEGDTTLTIYSTKEEYDKGYSDTYAWYKRAFGSREEVESEPPQTPPEKLRNIAKAIMKRFGINGVCDEMYICNVIAFCNDIGDGESHFTGDVSITDADSTAHRLQSAYASNIKAKDIIELKEIISA